MRGKFITLEGQDGAGKSTNLSEIEAAIRQAGHDLVVTREPGGTPVGEQIRELILSSQDESFGDMTELLLIFAARAQHIESVIEPALAAGKWVLSDRFTDATYAYQGGGRGLDPRKISKLETLVQGNLRPDCTFLLDLPVNVGAERAGLRSQPDRFERQRNDFKSSVRRCYLERAQADPKRFRVIDASLDLNTVKLAVRTQIDSFLAND